MNDPDFKLYNSSAKLVTIDRAKLDLQSLFLATHVAYGFCGKQTRFFEGSLSLCAVVSASTPRDDPGITTRHGMARLDRPPALYQLAARQHAVAHMPPRFRI
jgi:hypothetical protein